jgi:hypothetical protein
MQGEQEFHYRKYKTRALVAILFLVFIIPIQVKIGKSFSDDYFIYLCLISALIYIYIYYLLTRNHFIESGKYYFENNNVKIKLKAKEYSFNVQDIEEVICLKRYFLGQGFMLFLIKIKGNKIKILSEDIDKNVLIKTTKLFQLFYCIEQAGKFKRDIYSDVEECFVLKR